VNGWSSPPFRGLFDPVTPGQNCAARVVVRPWTSRGARRVAFEREVDSRSAATASVEGTQAQQGKGGGGGDEAMRTREIRAADRRGGHYFSLSGRPVAAPPIPGRGGGLRGTLYGTKQRRAKIPTRIHRVFTHSRADNVCVSNWVEWAACGCFGQRGKREGTGRVGAVASKGDVGTESAPAAEADESAQAEMRRRKGRGRG